ncbi:MAG: hypothetical protein KIS87_12430 [Phycisphaeraceae bacterium]|nr:hypothetical protein [Phycisphaeraceae bacterium]
MYEMSASYRALCSDFYVNQKVSLKLDLPRGREQTLELFERLRRQYPSMSHFRRYREELSLDTPPGESPHRWVAVRSNSIRSGVVNGDSLGDAYGLHRTVSEIAPYFLSVSPLDVDFVELLYGFDLSAGGNHDSIVASALLGGSPLGALAEIPGAGPIDCQPVLGLALGGGGEYEAYFEVRTRPASGEDRERERGEEPISVYLTVRRNGPFGDLGELPETIATLAERGEELIDSRVVPTLLVPIREAIVSGL